MSDLPPISEFEEKIRRAMDVPSADPAFVKSLGTQLASRPARTASRAVFRPAWALAIILTIALLALTFPFVVAAIGRLFGYVPGMGLVENTGNLRTLAQPVSQQRDGVTLTITNALVYPDRIELVYKVEGISNENDGYMAEDAAQDPTAFCGGVNIGETAIKDGDAMLRLPDGTLLEREYTGLYPQNAYAMTPVYKVSLPVDVTQLTLVLKCIPWARLGAVPENWEVPFKLAAVPAGTVVGLPVVEANIISEPVTVEAVSPAAALPSPQVTFTLERVAQLDTGTIFYFHLNVENPDPLLVSIHPRNVYVIDSLGRKIQAMNNGPISENSVGGTFEYVTTAKPADGALTLVVEDAVANYSPEDGRAFTFDVGENPQPGQTWELNKEFDIAGYKVEVASARAVTFSDIEDNPEMWDPQGGPDYPEGSQGFDYGYQFTLKLDPSSGILGGWMDILSDSCSPSEIRPMGTSPLKFYTQLCRDDYPKGNVKVILRGISVLVNDIGQMVWSPDGTTAPLTSVPAPKTPAAKLALDKVVPTGSGVVFYFSMDVENPDPSLQSVVPGRVYMIDSAGQQIPLTSGPIYPVEHPAGSLFEYFSTVKPAPGPLTLVIEDAVAHYAPLYVEPRQATPEEMSFTFDAGADPQPGQTWTVNKQFEIGGHLVEVSSARAVTFADIDSSTFIDSSQGYDHGYEFAVQGSPAEKISLYLDILSDACWLYAGHDDPPKSSSVLYSELCRNGYPKGPVTVTISELSVLVENTWETVWSPQ